jgi:hypothetical protein
VALRGLGRLDEAEIVVSEAITVATRREDGLHWYAPELFRVRADILLQQSADRSGLAEDCLGQALKMAREQGARTWELRTALSVARLREASFKQPNSGLVHDRCNVDLKRWQAASVGPSTSLLTLWKDGCCGRSHMSPGPRTELN